MALAFLCAYLSWRYIEVPFRRRELGATRRAIYAYSGAGLAFTFFLEALCMAFGGFPARLTPEAQAIANVERDSAFLNELTAEDVQTDRLVPIGSKDHSSPVTVLVWGDSHAVASLPALDDVPREMGLRGAAATRSATAPVLGWARDTTPNSERSRAFNDAVISYIAGHHISDVILVARWEYYSEPNSSDSEKSFISALFATIRAVGRPAESLGSSWTCPLTHLIFLEPSRAPSIPKPTLIRFGAGSSPPTRTTALIPRYFLKWKRRGVSPQSQIYFCRLDRHFLRD